MGDFRQKEIPRGCLQWNVLFQGNEGEQNVQGEVVLYSASRQYMGGGGDVGVTQRSLLSINPAYNIVKEREKKKQRENYRKIEKYKRIYELRMRSPCPQIFLNLLQNMANQRTYRGPSFREQRTAKRQRERMIERQSDRGNICVYKNEKACIGTKILKGESL